MCGASRSKANGTTTPRGRRTARDRLHLARQRRFQIRVANLITAQSRILAGEGSNEQPTWSPDGKWIAFQSNRGGNWQIYRMRVDGNDLQKLTSNGENKDPDWSKKAE